MSGITFHLLLLLALPTLITPSNSPSRHTHRICMSELDCTEDFMTCLENRCVCDDDQERLLEDQGLLNNSEGSPHECRGIAYIGEYCDNHTHICTANAYCSTNQSQCECKDGFELEKQMQELPDGSSFITQECRLGFGKPCNDSDTQLCNTEKFLTCMDNSCQCLEQYFGVKWDEALGKCVQSVGKDCELKEWFGIKLGCGRNAECIEQDGYGHMGTCECHKGFFEDLLGECVPIFGKKCNSSSGIDDECSQLHDSYHCGTKEKCSCKPNYVFVQELNECLLKVGEECDLTSNDCVPNASCYENICNCDDTFTPNSEGNCELEHGSENCTDSGSNQCNKEAGLICGSGRKCICPQGFIFEEERGICLGTRSAFCDPSNPRCVPYAECDPAEWKCNCLPEFTSDENGNCHHGHKTPCEPDASFKQCREELGMYCDNVTNVCECRAEQGKIYDWAAGKCKLKVGAHCNYLTNPRERCIRRAFCGKGDTCQCYAQFSPTQEGDCFLKWGQICDTYNEIANCNEKDGLTCTNYRCECLEGLEYNEEKDKCEFRSRKSVPFDTTSEKSSGSIAPFPYNCLNFLVSALYIVSKNCLIE